MKKIKIKNINKYVDIFYNKDYHDEDYKSDTYIWNLSSLGCWTASPFNIIQEN